MFDPNAPIPESGNGRYTIGTTIPTQEGDVGVGTDRRGSTFMVHAVGRTSEAIALHAVATGVASGKLIPYSELVSAIAAVGDLGKFKKALDAHV